MEKTDSLHVPELLKIAKAKITTRMEAAIHTRKCVDCKLLFCSNFIYIAF